MAIRLLPFRDYDEHDVVNLFKSAGTLEQFIDLSHADRRSTPQGDAGVFVKVSNGVLNTSSTDWDPIDIDAQTGANSLLGKTDYPNVAKNFYPEATLSVAPIAAPTDSCIGITLRQTVARDELGENLLYNQIKKDELFGVLPGEVVPVLSKGMISITADAFEGGTVGTAGQVLIGAADGQVAAVDRTAVADPLHQIIGTILAVGHRDDHAGALGGTNVFGNAGLMNGGYAIVKIDCA
jgi:hypothetical protein